MSEIDYKKEPGLGQFVTRLPIKSSMGKRQVTSLPHDTHPSELSVIVGTTIHGIHANCWMKDDDGRQFGMVLSHDVLIALHTQIGDAIKFQKERYANQA